MANKNLPKEVNEEYAPSFSTVKKWVSDFKRGSISLNEDARDGSAKVATTDKNIKKVYITILDDRRVKPYL